MEKDLGSMSFEELRSELARLQGQLEDLEDTFNFNLANTLDHHNEAMLREHEDEMDEYRETIARLKRMMEEKKVTR